jgi:hypothetical protein
VFCFAIYRDKKVVSVFVRFRAPSLILLVALSEVFFITFMLKGSTCGSAQPFVLVVLH